MEHPGEERYPAEGAVLQAMLLFSTLSTAAELWRATQERRAGRDPSAQEGAGVVRPYLRAAARELQVLLLRLRASLAYSEDAAEEQTEQTARLVRRFNDLVVVHRIERLLQVTHQRLLSLYPETPEAFVEQARLLRGEARVLLETEEGVLSPALEPFLGRALAFAEALRRALSSPA
jgi:hypothetical protein